MFSHFNYSLVICVNGKIILIFIDITFLMLFGTLIAATWKGFCVIFFVLSDVSICLAQFDAAQPFNCDACIRFRFVDIIKDILDDQEDRHRDANEIHT